MKEAAWESIQNEFNARSGGTFRLKKTLKVQYEGVKRTVRKKSAAIRSKLCRTGGGKNTPQAPSLDSVEEQIKTMISLSIDVMKSIYDSDILPQMEENQGESYVYLFNKETFTRESVSRGYIIMFNFDNH